MPLEFLSIQDKLCPSNFKMQKGMAGLEYVFQMLAAAHGVFSKGRQCRGGSRNSALVDQLLIILSDGRGVDESAVSQCDPPHATVTLLCIFQLDRAYTSAEGDWCFLCLCHS